MIRVADDLGGELGFARTPARIVSLVPSLTELVFALGAGDRVVGVTRYCVEPADQVGACPKVGGTKNPDLDAILRLRPDLVVVNCEENRLQDVEVLRAESVPVFVTDVRRVDEVPSLMRRLGRIVGEGAIGQALAAELETAMGSISPVSPRRSVFCPIWKNPWMSFNSDTYASDILARVGADNVCGRAGERYPRVLLEEVRSRCPDLVLLPDEPYLFSERDLPDLAPLGMRTGAVHLIDGRQLSWYGPRTASALRDLRSLLDSPGGPWC